ncbi:glutaredoxin domain-containing protein [Georgenia yuyongxinii]|uniref:NrdH-redoxin n=1 Tax=Georgenia yuyongxinii TaxID=2589797 RepID=A0A552WUJ8_9MICO|nr:glutaredoxin domain-containing protein [Georgenia yuyongxinii]TRW46427.1 NrdH-redoxin [Georgenia yuyongxinii]
MSVVVYSMPACPQCTATCRELSKRRLDYEVVDLTADHEALAMVRGLGYKQAPIVVAGREHWSGYRPDRIKALAAAAVPAQV